MSREAIEGESRLAPHARVRVVEGLSQRFCGGIAARVETSEGRGKRMHSWSAAPTNRKSGDDPREQDENAESPDFELTATLHEELTRGDSVLATRSDATNIPPGLYVPFSASGQVLGYLKFEWLDDTIQLRESLLEGLPPLGDIVANAILRNRSEAERLQLTLQLQQSQKLEAVGTLAAGVCHDFNNILTAVRCFADLAAESLTRDDDAWFAVEGVREASDRANAITRTLLTFSGKSSTERSPQRLAEVVDGAIGFVASAAISRPS